MCQSRSRYRRLDLEENKSWGQPLWAWLGLILCLAIVLLLNTASWWSGKINAKLDSAPRVLSAYIGVSILNPLLDCVLFC